MARVDKIENLRREITKREAELAELKSQLALAEAQRARDEQEAGKTWKWPLEPHHYQRYSRQMIVPKFGLQAQLRLNKARVLLVGAGGLGCPAAAYLAGAGVGVLGLVDGDVVEVSNLHRQVAHSTARVGMSKVESAITYLKGLNPSITYNAHPSHLTPQNAEEILSQYDLVLDCTDHPTSRYLISDFCVLLGKPLISASALQTSGQLIVLNNPPGKGPCYRCIWPTSPPPDSVVSCGEGGIVGPVVGVMGVLQALEAIKLIARGGLDVATNVEVKPTTMLLFSAMDDKPFRTVIMRGQRAGCTVCCENNATLTLKELKSSSGYYVQFCGVAQPVRLLQPEERITVHEYDRICREKEKHILVDVREKENFDICHLEGSINIPKSRFSRVLSHAELIPDELRADDAPIYVICRVGNDSQIVAKSFREMGISHRGNRVITDIQGGIKAWRDAIEPSFPFI